ncbi:MAG: hypothetical protein AAF403_05910 [Pseudomonadota bacterium]
MNEKKETFVQSAPASANEQEKHKTIEVATTQSSHFEKIEGTNAKNINDAKNDHHKNDRDIKDTDGDDSLNDGHQVSERDPTSTNKTGILACWLSVVAIILILTHPLWSEILNARLRAFNLLPLKLDQIGFLNKKIDHLEDIIDEGQNQIQKNSDFINAQHATIKTLVEASKARIDWEKDALTRFTLNQQHQDLQSALEQKTLQVQELLGKMNDIQAYLTYHEKSIDGAQKTNKADDATDLVALSSLQKRIDTLENSLSEWIQTQENAPMINTTDPLALSNRFGALLLSYNILFDTVKSLDPFEDQIRLFYRFSQDYPALLKPLAQMEEVAGKGIKSRLFLKEKLVQLIPLIRLELLGHKEMNEITKFYERVKIKFLNLISIKKITEHQAQISSKEIIADETFYETLNVKDDKVVLTDLELDALLAKYDQLSFDEIIQLSYILFEKVKIEPVISWHQDIKNYVTTFKSLKEIRTLLSQIVEQEIQIVEQEITSSKQP